MRQIHVNTHINKKEIIASDCTSQTSKGLGNKLVSSNNSLSLENNIANNQRASKHFTNYNNLYQNYYFKIKCALYHITLSPMRLGLNN